VSRKRLIWTAALSVAVLAIAGAAWSMRDDFAFAGMAAGFTAKQTCSCLNISGRSMESCLGDLPAEARGRLDVTAEGDRVRASVLFGAISAEAVYEEEFGCQLVN
jgi:hypothetical protein